MTESAEAPATQEPATQEPATQEPAAAPQPSDDAWKGYARKELIKASLGDPDATDGVPAEAPAETQTAEAAESLEPKASDTPDERTAKLEQLKAMAKELGLSVDDSAVSLDERKAFKDYTKRKEQWIREQEARFPEKERELQERWEKERSEFMPRVERAEAILNAIENARDYDEYAKATGLGFESWDEMQEDAVSRFTDPNYQWRKEQEKAVKQLKAEREKEEKERQKRQESERLEAEKKQREERVRQAQIAHLKQVQEEIQNSQDPKIQAFHDDPQFIRAIFEIQKANYDRTSDSTVSAEQAATMVLRGGNKPLLDQAKEQHARAVTRALKAFGVEVIPEEFRGKLAPQPPKSKAPKTEVVPSDKQPQVSPRVTSDREAWNKHVRSELRRATAIDWANEG